MSNAMTNPPFQGCTVECRDLITILRASAAHLEKERDVAAREAREAARIISMTKGIDLRREVERQDEAHPAGYPATRDGLRLGLAAMEDELREARDEWRAGRQDADWRQLRAELIQLAAVAIRAIRSIDTPEKPTSLKSPGQGGGQRAGSPNADRPSPPAHS